MVGSSIFHMLKKKGYNNLITVSKNKLNLIDQKKTFNFLKIQKPDVVIIASAKVGGIKANNLYRANFIYENLQIQNNLIHGSYLSKTKKLIFLGSSCVYPKICKQPIKEEYLLSSILEKTNEPYSIAKIAGLKMCESYNNQYNSNFICLMPCNLYGPNDNYDTENSHFLPALIKKIHDAKIYNKKEIILWGDGSPKREVMYVGDLADACVHFMKKNINHNYINVGSNVEYNIKEYCKIIMKIMNYNVKIKFDKNMPNGTPRKILDNTLANNYGWYPKTELMEGLKITISDYMEKIKKIR